MEPPQVVRELKRDEFGRIELLEGHAGLAIRRVACGGRAPGSGGIARLLARREARALAELSGLAGVAQLVSWKGYAEAPSLDGRVPRPKDVLLRSYLAGVPLFAADALPGDFFERLEDLVREIHERGVCHNDLHKEPNVLVGTDGYPALVDFQLASVHRRFGRGYDARVNEDLRHVAKHRRTYLRGTKSEDLGAATGLPGRRSTVAALWMRLGKPLYNRLRGKRRGGEGRRPRAGPWPEWTTPVGPRAGG